MENEIEKTIPSVRGEKKTRIYSYDVIRCLAILFVICIHSSGVVENFAYGTTEYWIGYCWFCLVKTAVPMFVMLSGALLLSKPIPLTKDGLLTFYKRRCLKVVTPFIIVSIIHYYFFQNIEVSYIRALLNGSAGVFHWYVYMICSFYFFAPYLANILQCRSRNVRLSIFILANLYLFFCLQPGLFLTRDLRMTWYPYIYLFIMGFYINEYRNWIKKTLTVKYVVISCVCFYLAGIMAVILNLTSRLPLYYYLPLSVSLFTLLLIIEYRKESKLVKKISRFSYTIYLIHGPLVMCLWNHPLSEIYPLSILINVLIVFAISYSIVWILSKIPHIGVFIGI